MQLYPETTTWVNLTPVGGTKSPYFCMGYSWQLPGERGWYEGIYQKTFNVRVGAGLWFLRKLEPNKVYFCLGVLRLDKSMVWQVLGIERKASR